MEQKMVQFTREDLANIKKALADARSQGKTEFQFKGNQYLCDYAKYLIEYLEGQFRVNKSK